MVVTMAMLLEYSSCCSSRYSLLLSTYNYNYYTDSNNNNNNYYYTTGSLPDGMLFMQFAVGALAMRGAGCTINDMWDRYTLINVYDDNTNL